MYNISYNISLSFLASLPPKKSTTTAITDHTTFPIHFIEYKNNQVDSVVIYVCNGYQR